tara:strand:- start:302 stop:418 length:117 start_codon:yes stop_codon:yes gene_type:complete
MMPWGSFVYTTKHMDIEVTISRFGICFHIPFFFGRYKK